MDRSAHSRQLFLAVFLLGLIHAGCATASPPEGEKAQTALPTTPTPLESQFDTSITAQAQTNQPQTDEAKPKPSEADEVEPPEPQNDLPTVVQPLDSETLPAQPSDNAPTAQPQTDIPPTAQQESAPTAPFLNDANPSIVLTGRVWRAKPGIVFLKTPIGLMSLSSKTTLKALPASQEVSFVVHEEHVVVDIVRRTDGALVHRYLTGPFKRDSGDGTKLVRWTPGGMRAFHMGTYERALTDPKNGESVTVEVDSAGSIIGVHDLQFDLQIGQVATNGAKAHVLLTGTISKLKSNFIFLRTPIGIINVNAKIGIKNVKVGQTLTLWMHDHHVVADLSASSNSGLIRRFLTGPLEFATPDRASVRLWTPEGEQNYPADLGKAALNGAREGTPVTLELDGQGDVVEFHRMK